MSALYAALCDLAAARDERNAQLLPTRDDARADLVTYIKALHARRPIDALQIASRWGLEEYDPAVVTVGLTAAAAGGDAREAADTYLEEEQ